MAGKNYLGYALPSLYLEWFGREIDQDYLEFSPIIGIDGSRGVEYGQATAGGKSAARAYLDLISGRDFQKKAGRHYCPAERFDNYCFWIVRTHVHTCGKGCGVLGKSV